MILSRRVVQLNPRMAPLLPALTSLWAVEEQIAAGTVFPPEQVDRLALLATDTGRVRDGGPDGRRVHSPRGLTVLPSGGRYHNHVEPGAPWRIHYIMLRGPWASRFDATLARSARRELLYEASPLHGPVREAVQLALNQPAGWEWGVVSRLAEVLGALVNLGAPSDAEADLTERARRMIESQPRRAWPVAELAAALGVAPSTLAHRFRAATGQPPAAWVRRRRVEHARRLLEQGMSVVAVADRMGFANPYHFSRVFKAVTGAPPSSVKTTSAAPLHGVRG